MHGSYDRGGGLEIRTRLKALANMEDDCHHRWSGIQRGRVRACEVNLLASVLEVQYFMRGVEIRLLVRAADRTRQFPLL